MTSSAALSVPRRGGLAVEPHGANHLEPPTVFIIHGTDVGNLRVIASQFFRRYGIEPVGLENREASGASVKLEICHRIVMSTFVLAIWTPDESVGSSSKFQPRPNVFAETFYALNARKAGVLWVVQNDVEPVPSNFRGDLYASFRTPEDFVSRLEDRFKRRAA
jgi:predicted nucleotide-binding protein